MKFHVIGSDIFFTVNETTRSASVKKLLEYRKHIEDCLKEAKEIAKSIEKNDGQRFDEKFIKSKSVFGTVSIETTNFELDLLIMEDQCKDWDWSFYFKDTNPVKEVEIFNEMYDKYNTNLASCFDHAINDLTNVIEDIDRIALEKI